MPIRRRAAHFGGMLLGWMLSSSALFAQAPVVPDSLTSQVESLRTQFRPLDANLVAARRAELAKAVAELEPVLNNSGPQYAAGWKTYLHWNDLSAALPNDAPIDANALTDVWRRFSRNNRGLEMTKFLAVRDRLRALLDAWEFSRLPKTDQYYSTVLDDLSTRLARYRKEPTGSDGVELGRLVGWLERTGQAPTFVSEVRSQYAAPNMHLDVSRRLLAQRFERTIDQTLPVTDNILGTAIRGTAHTTGASSLSMQNSSDNALMAIMLNGTAHSRTVGRNGPVTIHSTGTTNIFAYQYVTIDEHGLRAQSTHAKCDTNTHIHAINAKCGLIEKIAWKKAGQQKGAAERIASRHAEQRVSRQMDEESAPALAEANQAFLDHVRHPLTRRGYSPKQMKFSSWENGLRLIMLQQGRNQLGAPSAPPAVPSKYDLTVRAHESFVANMSAAVIGGFELTDENAQKLVFDATGEVPEELQITEDTEPWTMTFADDAPVNAAFNDDKVRLAIRVQRLTRGRDEQGRVENDVRGLIEISALYKIELMQDGAMMTRQGDLEVEFIDLKKLSAAQVATKTFLKRKFSTLFKPEIVSSGIELDRKHPELKRGRLVPREIRADDGWYTAGWEHVPN